MAEHLSTVPGVRLERKDHRWPRAHIGDAHYGPTCDCGNLKTDQALSCFSCAVERRRASDYRERRTCACGGPKGKSAKRCRACYAEERRGDPACYHGGG